MYDGEERITKVIDSFDGITEYEYDALGQLKTETVNGTVVNNMTYDNYGNITEKNGVVYHYGNAVWKDLLTQVGTGANSTISYDANGNPTTYLGHTLTWEKGRQLKKFDNIEYTYNANGIRTSKKVNGVLHTYTLDGTKILRETRGENTLVPLYDNEDSICGILYNSVPYYFIKNLQGDVIAIVDKDAQTVARYSYDAWGVPTIKEDTSGCNIATVNPFRYRGYYYDAETNLYYLQSRYYDPEVGRFINADELLFLGKERTPLNYNAFSYCENNVVNATDSMGYASKKTYSGVVGFGLQISINVNMLCYQGIFGIEAIWFAFTKNNNFNNGLIPWVYCYGGFSVGVSFDITKLLSKSLLDSPKKLLSGIGFNLSCSLGVTFFLVTANKMSGPKDYLRDFEFSSVTVWGVTVSRAAGSNITTYGVGFTWEIGASLRKGISIGKKLFGTSGGYSFYWAVPIGRNAKELYNTVKKRV